MGKIYETASLTGNADPISARPIVIVDCTRNASTRPAITSRGPPYAMTWPKLLYSRHALVSTPLTPYCQTRELTRYPTHEFVMEKPSPKAESQLN